MNYNEIILKALDEVEELRQKLAEGPLDDYDIRVTTANIAQMFADAELHNRANWCDKLKENADSKYHQRYYHGVFHI
jgi:hypothetical protein